MTDGLTTRLDAADEVTWPARPIPSPRRRGNRIAVVARRGGKLIVALVSVAVLTVTWYGWQFIGDPNSGLSTTGVFDDEELHAVPLDGAIDILLVGMDSRTDAQGNPLPREVLDMLHAGDADGEKQTDTMILVHIPQDGRRAVAISFPRDSWVELSGGFGKHKLNGAFVYAYNDKFRELQQQGVDLADADDQAKVAGRKNLISTLETFIGKPGMIDRYAEVNLASFYEVTRALGGIEVCLKAPVRERKSGVDLPAGRQTVEGVQALAFVRQRYDLPNGDLDRIARQQAFLSGLARKMLSRDVLANPGKLADVINAVKKSVVLSDNWDLPEFAAQMRGLNGGNIEFRTIPVIGNAVIGGADVVRVDPAAVHTFVDQLTADPGTRTSTSVTATSSPPSSSVPATSSRRVSSPPPATSSSASTTTSPPPPPITAGDVPCVN
ncbi:LCP family protein [Amycolatopsis thermophila]|uniref:LCP family protein required for cell wall assembly n=1 Tax=Amycolatopsis thermophila TaxID=206084 RepID=A0ABU0EPU1_9PSEU|nr:LCP family protein [Amycolatopsis thermophila]MDQ0377306.1 LCP family protein required for cell wall assembly [Amycolatopsis thermophila]